MYYNPQLGGNVSNLCGYGNHAACTIEGCECSCHPVMDNTLPEDTDTDARFVGKYSNLD